jgi:hypothetical protein
MPAEIHHLGARVHDAPEPEQDRIIALDDAVHAVVVELRRRRDVVALG